MRPVPAIILAIVATVVFMGLLALVTGCKAAAPAADVNSYEAQQIACIEEAGSRIEADICRNRVKASFGRLTYWDAGEGGQ